MSRDDKQTTITALIILVIAVMLFVALNGCEQVCRPSYQLWVTHVQSVEYSQTDRSADGTYDITKNWFDQHTISKAVEDITIRCKVENTSLCAPIGSYHIKVIIFYELGDFDVFYQNEYGIQPGYYSNNVIFVDDIRLNQCIENIHVSASLTWVH